MIFLIRSGENSDRPGEKSDEFVEGSHQTESASPRRRGISANAKVRAMIKHNGRGSPGIA